MVIAILVIIIFLLSFKWWAERLRCKAIIYYLVDNNYTAPTKNDVERCIRIVIEKTVNGWFKR